MAKEKMFKISRSATNNGIKRKIPMRCFVLCASVFCLALLFYCFIRVPIPKFDLGESECRSSSSNVSNVEERKCSLSCQMQKPLTIFFLETSGKSELTIRQMCAVESATLQNPNSHVLVLKMITRPGDDLLEVHELKHLRNVEVIPFDAKTIVCGTPLQSWFVRGVWSRSSFKIHHLSDALRLALLWQYGGIYLDLDVVVLRSMEHLKNTVVAEHANTIGTAFLTFEPGHEFVMRTLTRFVKKYDPNQFAINGPQTLSDCIRENCKLKKFNTSSPYSCDNKLDILPPVAAYPYTWQEWKAYFQVDEKIKDISKHFKSTYLFHVWNKMSGSEKLKIGSNTLYERAANMYCPLTYTRARKIGYI